jgi:hypothetical protein
MKKKRHITQALVQELVSYDARRGLLTWKLRGRHHFKSDSAWKRWNKRYAGLAAFTYEHGGYRWGSMFNQNQLAHRIVWMHVYGVWPEAIAFKDGDATNLKLSNMYDRLAPPPPSPRVRLHNNPERIRLAA